MGLDVLGWDKKNAWVIFYAKLLLENRHARDKVVEFKQKSKLTFIFARNLMKNMVLISR